LYKYSPKWNSPILFHPLGIKQKQSLRLKKGTRTVIIIFDVSRGFPSKTEGNLRFFCKFHMMSNLWYKKQTISNS